MNRTHISARRFFAMAALLVMALALASCTKAGRMGESAAAAAPARPFVFIQMTDPQFGFWDAAEKISPGGFERETRNFEAAIAEANRLRPDFVVITGDMINEPGDAAETRELLRVARGLDPAIPLYWVAGNHDVGAVPTSATLAFYRETFGPDWYAFTHAGQDFIVLNSTLMRDPGGAPDEAARQWAWLEAELARCPGAIVFMHHPIVLRSPDEPDEYFNLPGPLRARLLGALQQGGARAVFSGHYHRNALAQDGAMPLVTTGPVGMPIGAGNVSGFRIVRVSPEAIEHAFYPLAAMPEELTVEMNTFSIVAADPATGELGVAVATRLPAVGMYVPFVEAGVGAVASQAIVNPAYGPRCLELLRQGATPEDVIRQVTAADERRADRQLSVINARGQAASYTGGKNSQACGHLVGENYAVAGNLLATTETLHAMARAFEAAQGRLGDRMLAAMAAGEAAGGDRRGKQSAAILIKKPGAYFNDKMVDLRVDDHADPIAELWRVYGVYMATFLNLPGYRPLGVGDQGGDVAKLNRWLAEAGYGDAAALGAAGDRFTESTATALRKATGATDSAVAAPALTPLRAWELQQEADRAKAKTRK